MSGRLSEALTGRRLGGALFVLGGIVVAAIVLWPSGDREPSKRGIQPVRLVSVPQLGIAFAHPRAWSRSIAGRVIRLRSPDRAATLTVASPLAGRHTRQVKGDLRATLREALRPAKIVRDGPAKIGRRPATSFELTGTAARKPIRMLVLVGSSRYRTYAITLLTPRRPSARRLVEAQQILATVRLTKPGAARLPSKR